MSFLGSLFGGPNVQQVTQSPQVQAANEQAQNLIQQQQQSSKQQQDFLNALAAQNGIQNQQNVFNQLQDVAKGQGPNPAQAQLAQATGQNVANQAALMAGQRGINANPALLARQAAQQGAATQQNAAGQAATMQAQQSLGALNQLSGIAGTQVGQQQAGINNLAAMQQANTNAALNQQGALSGQINAQNQANQAAYSSQIQPAMQLFGAGAKAASAAIPGGQVASNMAEGGVAGAANPTNQSADLKESYGKKKKFIDHFAEGGETRSSLDMKKGGHVPGKAKVGGAKNDYKNDTVPAVLSPGEVVLPRSVTKSANPAEAAKKFVEALNKKKSKK